MLPLAAPPLHLLAPAYQAGGGGGFGGGGGGGGGGGDSDGLFQIVYWLIRLAIEVPVVGIPLCVIVFVVIVVGMRKGWWKHQERVIHRGAPLLAQHRALASAAPLRERDPGFDEARFLARAGSAFRKAQSAWCAQKLETLRPFVSDAVLERFSLQIAQQREEGWRQGMQSLRVGAIALQHVESGRLFDTITVRIPFECDIHRLRLDSGARIANSELPRREFEECWSFVRRRGAHTKTSAGLIEGQCPNCGAPLEMNQSLHCASCQCLVRSGEFDWVLTEITQASEWGAQDELSVAGLTAYAERDAGLSVQLLEDRTSVAFWRWSESERTGRADPLARVTETAFYEQAAAELAARAQARRTYSADRAVGSVRTLGILAGEAWDRAVVEVVWDGRLVTLEPGATNAGELPSAPGERRALRRTLFVLTRRAGETSSVSDAFTSARCRNCGAHDAGGTDPRCPYCAAPRTGDASTWLVVAILGQSDPRAVRLRGELAAVAPPVPSSRPPPASGLLAWAVALARADGEIHASERRALQRLGSSLAVSADRIEALLAAKAADHDAPMPRTPIEARAWLVALSELALADGALASAEKVFLRDAATRMGMPRYELVQAVRATRTALYRESRRAAREA